jgi:hypothetical protein
MEHCDPLKAAKDQMVRRQDAIRKSATMYDAYTERETLIYWLLCAYQSGHREGWEDGPNTDETMDGILSVLANRGYDPNLSNAAKELLSRPPKF